MSVLLGCARFALTGVWTSADEAATLDAGEGAMAVYVRKLQGQGRAFFGRTASPDPWFVLTADSDDELHAFAAGLGLTRVMFRPGTEALPGRVAAAGRVAVAGHYDITVGERDRAVALGAQAVRG